MSGQPIHDPPAPPSTAAGPAARLADYAGVFRPLHWVKNAFAVFGALCAYSVLETPPPVLASLGTVALALFAACLASSASYGINEALDARRDQHHPTKRDRPLARGTIRPGPVYLVSALLWPVSVGLAYAGGGPGPAAAVLGLLVAGLVYNVPPVRLKDVAYVDVLVEAANNPIRLLVGWLCFPAAGWPPLSLIAAFWCFGALLMSGKRYAELRAMPDRETAVRYRSSFKGYTHERLMLAMIVYLSGFMFAVGVLCIKYRLEVVLALPLLVAQILYYFHLAVQPESIVRSPDDQLRHVPLLALSLACAIAIGVLLFVRVPFLDALRSVPFQP